MATLTADQALANPVQRHCLSASGISVETIAAQIVGLHNTNPVSPYLSLLARLDGFQRADLDAAMWGSWDLARFRAMRLTIFVLSHQLLEIAGAATRHISSLLADRWLRDSGLTPAAVRRLESGVLEVLADGPRTSRQLRAALGVPQNVDLPGVVGRMCDKGTLVGGPPPGNWRSGVRQYHIWGDVLPTVDLERLAPRSAINELVLRYIRAYGPVSIADISWWTGFTKGRCRQTVARLRDDLEEVAVEGWPGPMYRTLDGEAPAELSPAVKALPMLDPYVQGYRDRERLLDPKRHDFVYDGGGNSAATLVSLGRIVGVWQFAHKPAKQIRYHVFAAGPASLFASVGAALDAAGRLFFDSSFDLVQVAVMKPLTAAGGRSALHPLDSQLH